MYRKTVVEINLRAIRHNIESLKKSIHRDVKFMIPVKADAYGHGITRVSRYMEQNGLVDMLGVASLDEGIELRKGGITLPVLVLGLLMPGMEQIDALLKYGLSQTVADAELASQISERASSMNTTAALHLKVDTGMGRIGCGPDAAVAIAAEISALNNVVLEGIYSHFPDADEPACDFTLDQISTLKEIITQLDASGVSIPYRHIANSAGIINYPGSVFNMVRPGIIVYGYLPSPGIQPPFKVVPAMTMKSAIMFTKRISAGTPLSYGRTYSAEKDENIATIPLGYGDGYSRLLSNRGKVIIRDKIYPVVGRVSMDQILVNLGDDIYPAGEEVILFGEKTITADTVASWIDTIPYEITCGISKRVPRIYIE